MTVGRWLLLMIAVLAMLMGVSTMPQRARADEPQYALFALTELGWMRYVSPKGYIAKPQTPSACEVDRVSVANLRQGYRLECRPVR